MYARRMRAPRRIFWLVFGVLALCGLVAWIDPYPDDPAAHVLRSAGASMRKHRQVIDNPKYCIVIDYDRPVFAHRLWVVERRSGDVVLRSRVSHAFLTGPIRATRFSNKPNSHLSCRGAFVTRNSYHGRFGRAMRVAGLEPGLNDNALQRAIVFHSHTFIFWSGGCFVTPAKINDRLIDLTRNGTFVYVHRSAS